MKKLTLFLISLLTGIAAQAADVRTVEGEATFYDDGTHSRIECMRIAAEQARIKALAAEFGTIIAQDVVQTNRVSGNQQHSDFLSLSTSEVRGEWICDEGEPKYQISTDNEGNFVITCKIRGSAAPLSNRAAEFNAGVLRNAPDPQAVDNRFRSGDSMFLLFNGSTDGFVAAFLEDEAGNVFGILPYIGDSASRVPVRKNRNYIFFSQANASDRVVPVDEYQLTADARTEYNRLYVVYSPQAFSKPVMQKSHSGIPAMSSVDFRKWLSRARRNDPAMGVKAINIEIEPRN